MAQWSPGDNVVVLGAGATRGAEWVESQTPLCLPPLNADFFTQLQRVTAQQHQGAIKEVLGDVLRLYGANFRVTLEQYFTQLETLKKMTAMLGTASGPLTPESVARMHTSLLTALSAVLEESADVVKSGSLAHSDPCGYHESLVKALRARDTVVSFNYDCVMDHALRTSGEGKWSARYGYGFKNPSRVIGARHWDAEGAPEVENSSVNLLKLHGSLNFFPFPEEDGGAIKLRQRTYRQNGVQRYEIIPPEFAKEVDRPEYKTLWGKAELALRHARCVTLIGFSFTPTDMAVDSFFRLALAENRRIDTLVIVNPSPQDRARVRQVFVNRLGKRNVRVVQFDRFRDFAPHVKAFLQ